MRLGILVPNSALKGCVDLLWMLNLHQHKKYWCVHLLIFLVHCIYYFKLGSLIFWDVTPHNFVDAYQWWRHCCHLSTKVHSIMAQNTVNFLVTTNVKSHTSVKHLYPTGYLTKAGCLVLALGTCFPFHLRLVFCWCYSVKDIWYLQIKEQFVYAC